MKNINNEKKCFGYITLDSSYCKGIGPNFRLLTNFRPLLSALHGSGISGRGMTSAVSGRGRTKKVLNTLSS